MGIPGKTTRNREPSFFANARNCPAEASRVTNRDEGKPIVGFRSTANSAWGRLDSIGEDGDGDREDDGQTGDCVRLLAGLPDADRRVVPACKSPVS